MSRTRANAWIMTAGLLLLAFCFFCILFFGPVDIPGIDVWNVLLGRETGNPYVKTIVLESRLSMAIAAASCGASLSVAGLMMQTIFHNPLAGPSVLGISSGASFGVALFMLCTGGLFLFDGGLWQPFLSVLTALAGGLITILILFAFSSFLKSGVALLVVGVMLGYLFSSGISLLNYFAKADEIRNYLIWGLGSFSGLSLHSSLWMTAATVPVLIICFLYVKPLNAMLLGERYMESVGYRMGRVRGGILLLTGLLVAVATAFCGPIGFIGLIVPHLCRMLFRTSNHLLLMPASIIFGAMLSSLCALLSILPAERFGVLPVNVITPLLGVPVIFFLLTNRKRLPYLT